MRSSLDAVKGQAINKVLQQKVDDANALRIESKKNIKIKSKQKELSLRENRMRRRTVMQSVHKDSYDKSSSNRYGGTNKNGGSVYDNKVSPRTSIGGSSLPFGQNGMNYQMSSESFVPLTTQAKFSKVSQIPQDTLDKGLKLIEQFKKIKSKNKELRKL